MTRERETDVSSELDVGIDGRPLSELTRVWHVGEGVGAAAESNGWARRTAGVSPPAG